MYAAHTIECGLFTQIKEVRYNTGLFLFVFSCLLASTNCVAEYCQPQSMLNMVPPLVMNIVTDLIIMAIPAPVVVPVKIGIWKRIGLLCLFGAGIFIMVAAILRVTMVLVVSLCPTS